LTALEGPDGRDERTSYFYCLKMFGILPVPPNSGFENWQFYTPPAYVALLYKVPGIDTTLYTPKCLHDVLISSHVTTCEHSSLYFSYYHRNLMILTEIFLNFAHQVLKGGEKKLKEIYPPSDFPNLYTKGN
jgi:hypothetical protein